MTRAEIAASLLLVFAVAALFYVWGVIVLSMMPV